MRLDPYDQLFSKFQPFICIFLRHLFVVWFPRCCSVERHPGAQFLFFSSGVQVLSITILIFSVCRPWFSQKMHQQQAQPSSQNGCVWRLSDNAQQQLQVWANTSTSAASWITREEKRLCCAGDYSSQLASQPANQPPMKAVNWEFSRPSFN